MSACVRKLVRHACELETFRSRTSRFPRDGVVKHVEQVNFSANRSKPPITIAQRICEGNTSSLAVSIYPREIQNRRTVRPGATLDASHDLLHKVNGLLAHDSPRVREER